MPVWTEPFCPKAVDRSFGKGTVLETPSCQNHPLYVDARRNSGNNFAKRVVEAGCDQR